MTKNLNNLVVLSMMKAADKILSKNIVGHTPVRGAKEIGDRWARASLRGKRVETFF